MTEKPKLELITLEHVEKLRNITGVTPTLTDFARKDYLNTLLSERLKVAKCQVIGLGEFPINVCKDNSVLSDEHKPTHDVYYFLKPLKEEKVECDLNHSKLREMGCNYCNECGKKLTKGAN